MSNVHDVRESSLTTQLGILNNADKHSWYTILGASDVTEYVEGYTKELAEAGCGTPRKWYVTTGNVVDNYALNRNADIPESRLLPPHLMVILFPLDGLDPGRLPIFKLRWQDHWFDDVVQNMVRS